MRGFRIPFALLGAAVLFACLPARAHEGATGIVKERMDAMESLAKAMKEIRRRIEANRDLTGIAPYAARIAATAKAMPQWFPPGSNARPSEALSAIWQRWPAFETAATLLDQASDKLGQAAVSGDPKSVAYQYRVVGEACSGCHQDFRLKK